MEFELENRELEVEVQANQLEFGSTDSKLELETSSNKIGFEAPKIGFNYNNASNKPSINGVELVGNKTTEDLGLQPKGDYANKDEIPTKTSQLENDSSFLTEHQDLSEYAKNTDIPTKTSELENDSEFITKELDDDFQTSGKIYLTSVKSGVSDAGASRIVFGTPSKTYSYLSSNTSGAFAFSKGNGNITLYPNTGTYNCLMTDCNSDLGRSDRKWKDLYLGGSLKDGTNTIPISNIATKDYVEETIGDIETLLGGI